MAGKKAKVGTGAKTETKKTKPAERPALPSAAAGKASPSAGRLKRWAKAVGSLAMSQSHAAQRNYVALKTAQASVETYKQALSSELSSLATIRKKLLDRLTEASGREKLQIRNELRFLEEET